MTQYLKTPGDFLTTEIVYKSTLDYISEELRQNMTMNKLKRRDRRFVDDNGEEVVQCFMEHSPSMKMYGTVKEFMENVRVYREFPGAQRYFSIQNDPYFASARVYQSVKGHHYISKTDLLIVLQNMSFHLIPGSREHHHRAVICTTVQEFEIRRLQYLEFVRFDEKALLDVRRTVGAIGDDFILTDDDLSNLGKLLYAKRFEQIYDLLPVTRSSLNDKEAAVRSIQLFHKKNAQDPMTRSRQTQEMAIFLNKTIIMNHLKTVLDYKMFQPLSGDVKGPITVRLFEDGGRRFAMKAEFFSALGRMSGKPSTFPQEKDAFSTVSWDEIQTIYAKVIQNFEFILTPINRTRDHATPVLGLYPGEYGILAVDGFLEFLRSLLVGIRFFQKNKNPDWTEILKLFNELEETFKTGLKTPYFLTEYVVKGLIRDFRMGTSISMFIVTNDVRPLKKRGFTLEELNDEILHLGLNDAFPKILEHTENVFLDVDRMKKGKKLRTCDMYDALFYCQLICFLDMAGNYKLFLHNQNGCSRVPGLRCEFCKTDPNPTVPPSPPTVPTELLNIYDEEDDDEEEEEDAVFTCGMLTPPPSSSYSNSAEREVYEECYLDDADLQLRIAQAKLDEMSKKMAEKEKEIVELKKEHKKGMDEKKMKMDEKQKEIENLKKKIEKLADGSNEELKLKIVELEAVNSKLQEAQTKQEKAQTKATCRIQTLEQELQQKTHKAKKAVSDKENAEKEWRNQLEEIQNLHLKVLNSEREGKEKELDDIKKEHVKEMEELKMCKNQELAEVLMEKNEKLAEKDEILKENELKIAEILSENAQLKLELAEIQKKEDVKKSIEEEKEKKEQEEILREKEELKAKIVELEEAYARQDKTYREAQSQLFIRISYLENEVTCEKTKTRQYEKDIQQKVEQEIQLKQEMDILHQWNVRLDQENQESEKTIKEFKGFKETMAAMAKNLP